MKRFISAKLAANVLLAAMGALVVFHILVLLEILPSGIVWGGRTGESSGRLLLLRRLGDLRMKAGRANTRRVLLDKGLPRLVARWRRSFTPRSGRSRSIKSPPVLRTYARVPDNTPTWAAGRT